MIAEMNSPFKGSGRQQFVISLPVSTQPAVRFPDSRALAKAKVRIGLTPRVASRVHTRPTHSPTPSLHRPVTEAKPNPSLSNLFKANVLVTRLSTATNSPGKRVNRPPGMSWTPYRRKPLLSSLVGSSATLGSGKDLDLVVLSHQPDGRNTSLNLSTASEQPKRRRHPRTSLSLPPPCSKKPVEPKVPLRDACRDFEWLAKAREQLTKDWVRSLRLSNGVAVEAANEPFFTYKYYLGRGNNHHLVKACFRARPQWARLKDEDELPKANLVWTQSKVKTLFKDYPVTPFPPPTVAAPSNSIICSVKLSAKNAHKNASVDVQSLGYDLITRSASYTSHTITLSLDSAGLRTHNKLEHNYHLTNKKSLFFSMKAYYRATGKDPFSVIPLTFHIKDGAADPDFNLFLRKYREIDRKLKRDDDGEAVGNIWIVKPGENTNRGTGISVFSTLSEIKAEVSTRSVCPITGQRRTFILQKYLETPLLVHKRKFDIRCYGLMTCINGVVQGYYYKEGYLRTSSREFDLADVSDRFVHLTNDAVQKHCEDYGRFESGNKLSYSDFQRYLDIHYPGTSVPTEILPQIKQAVKDTFMAAFAKVNSDKRLFSFEVLGYDFMVDTNMKVWLIEVNTNPCLELSSPLLARIIPAMLDNAFRIAVDPYFPESQKRPYISLTGEPLPENRFELVFHSNIEGMKLRRDLGEKFRGLEEFDRALQDMPEEEELADSSSSDDGC